MISEPVGSFNQRENVMDYTKNQHVLSQWVLRNFRSDDTALYAKEKQRVWCHTVYMTPEKENVLHTGDAANLLI
ncbi:hypothetical protein DS822_24810 [Escherichia coli]|nr:hypothetical protein [Escherichia coli]